MVRSKHEKHYEVGDHGTLVDNDWQQLTEESSKQDSKLRKFLALEVGSLKIEEGIMKLKESSAFLASFSLLELESRVKETGDKWRAVFHSQDSSSFLPLFNGRLKTAREMLLHHVMHFSIGDDSTKVQDSKKVIQLLSASAGTGMDNEQPQQCPTRSMQEDAEGRDPPPPPADPGASPQQPFVSVSKLKELPLVQEIEKLKDLSVMQELEKLKELPVVQEMGKLRGNIPNMDFTGLADMIPSWGRPSQGFPDKQRLSSVQEFFRYTEAEGRKLFEELDADGDGEVRLEDLERAMRRRRLPVRYARQFLRRTRQGWLAQSFGWGEFRALMEQKEASMLRAFTSLSVTPSGTLQKGQVLASLRRAGLPATEGNARAMMAYLDADVDRGHVAYGQFRNFLLLLPPERLERDPSMVWFEAATVVPMSPPPSAPAGSVLKSALAGGLASGLSTVTMHPVDTLKTRVQASSISFAEVMKTIPRGGGLVGLYRGSIPAILGQFGSHGVRTGVFEASKLLLHHMLPDLSELQVQPLASFLSSVLGTGVRIPCEVLKQRLQAELYPDTLSALRGTLRQEGLRGLFRGTTATLCREVPFYVAGLLIYQETKKVVKGALRRELAPWEMILVGGFSGGLAAVTTTPFDVIKTRMMIAPAGSPAGLVGTGLAIVAGEGVLALYKGALPRFFWIAPLGAMNFAGYELAKTAMDKQSS